MTTSHFDKRSPQMYGSITSFISRYFGIRPSIWSIHSDTIQNTKERTLQLRKCIGLLPMITYFMHLAILLKNQTQERSY